MIANGAVNYQDIDFDRHPKFSGDYLLQGEDEAAIRGFFSAEILTFFEKQQGLCVEGGGDQLVFYRKRNRIKPEEISGFMEEGFRVFDVFRGPE